MLRSHIRFSLLATLSFVAAACTQEPAQIDLRGQNSFTRDGSGYASNYSGPISKSSAPGGYVTGASSQIGTATTASVQSIGVSDLTPLSGEKTASASSAAAISPSSTNSSSWQSTRNAPASSPFKPAKIEKKAEIAPVSDGSINPWTRKPRETAAADALDESFNIRPQAKAAGAKKEQMVSEVKIVPISEQANAHLDSIVSNESTSDIQKTDRPAPAKMAKADRPSGANFIWPVNSKKIISGFGPKGSGKINDGINIASAEGEPVFAAAEGEVVYVGNELQGYGNMVLIKHGDNKTTTYAHLNRFTVDKYDRVKQGDIIGYVGSTGSVKEPQLHFAIRDGKEPVDPLKQLNRSLASRE